MKKGPGLPGPFSPVITSPSQCNSTISSALPYNSSAINLLIDPPASSPTSRPMPLTRTLNGRLALRYEAKDFVGENMLEAIERLEEGATISIDLSDKGGSERAIRSTDAMLRTEREPLLSDDGG